MITPARLDLTIYAGATYRLEVALEDADGTPVDLTERTLAAEVRNPRGTARLGVFTVTKSNPLQGTLVLSMTAAQTASLPVNRSAGSVANSVVGSWDLRITEPDGETVNYWLEGEVKTNVGVTLNG